MLIELFSSNEGIVLVILTRAITRSWYINVDDSLNDHIRNLPYHRKRTVARAVVNPTELRL